MQAIMLVVALSIAADDRGAAAIALAEAEAKLKPSDAQRYAAAYTEAVNLRKALVVGIGCPPPAGDWITVQCEHLEGFTHGITAAAWCDGTLCVAARLGLLPSSADVRAVLSQFDRDWGPFAEWRQAQWQPTSVQLNGIGGGFRGTGPMFVGSRAGGGLALRGIVGSSFCGPGGA